MKKHKDPLKEAERADRISTMALVISIIVFILKVASLFL